MQTEYKVTYAHGCKECLEEALNNPPDPPEPIIEEVKRKYDITICTTSYAYILHSWNTQTTDKSYGKEFVVVWELKNLGTKSIDIKSKIGE